MSRWQGMAARLRALFRRRSADYRTDAEFQFHLDMETERNVKQGMSAEQARRTAILAFGGVVRHREDMRDRRAGWLAEVARDMQNVRFAFRMWRAFPLLTFAAIASLALGMGANTAVYSVLRPILLKAPNVRNPGAMVLVYSARPANPGLHGSSYPNFDDVRASLPFDIAAFAPLMIGLSAENGNPEQISAELVSDNFFQLLGVSPVRGRTFAKGEATIDGRGTGIVISDALWRRRFSSRPDIVGQRVSIDAHPVSILAVLPPDFAGLDVMRAVDAWVPVSLHDEVLTGVQRLYFRQRSSSMFDLVARIPTGGTSTLVATALAARANVLALTHPDENKGLTFIVRSLSQARTTPDRRDTWVRAGSLLAAIVALVLLIACANVANLLLARSATRQREFALRRALGASASQLMRQVLVESAMLSTVGAIAGLMVAWASVRMLYAMQPAFLPASFRMGIDWHVILFTGLLVSVTSLLFGLAPALHISRQALAQGLSLRSTDSESSGRVPYSRVLLGVQSTLATVALVTAGLFLRSLYSAQQINPGFDVDRVALVSFDLGMMQYDNNQGPAFVKKVNERLAAMPGVRSTSVSSHVMLDGPALESKIHIEGRENAEALGVSAQAVGLNYFQTMGIPLTDGRVFQSTDVLSKSGLAIVNAAMARQLWPDRPAVGQRFQILGIREAYVVIGVVANSRYEALNENQRPYFYIFYDQTPGLKKLTFFVKTIGDPRSMLPAFEKEIHAVDPALPLLNVRTMSDVLKQGMSASRMGSMLLVSFGALSLVLAVVGTYGVTAFFIRQRRQEIGIRLALGATPSAVLRPLMSRTLVPAFIGICCGLLAAAVVGQLIASLLVGISPTDLSSFVVAGAVLATSAFIASLVPAVAAMRLDPAGVLRQD